jgi:hypothetical protein
MSEESLDGYGDPLHNTPLAAPYGSEVLIALLDNLQLGLHAIVQTELTMSGGRASPQRMAARAAMRSPTRTAPCNSQPRPAAKDCNLVIFIAKCPVTLGQSSTSVRLKILFKLQRPFTPLTHGSCEKRRTTRREKSLKSLGL